MRYLAFENEVWLPLLKELKHPFVLVLKNGKKVRKSWKKVVAVKDVRLS